MDVHPEDRPGVVTCDLHAFLKKESNRRSARSTFKAMPIILTAKDEIEEWPTAP